MFALYPYGATSQGRQAVWSLCIVNNSLRERKKCGRSREGIFALFLQPV
jgi:hypothetical protein